MVASIPAPWSLKGKGYIIIYKFKSDFIKKHGNIPDFLNGQYTGGFGSIMLVDYSESDAGPYSELLFIPGKFKFKGRKLDTISKIYVSTMESVENGRNNWGIPKEQADFIYEKLDNHKEHIKISSKDAVIADFVISSGGFPFPVSTKLLPFPLVQLHEGKYYYTNFYGNGKGKLAKIEDVKINPGLFPDISKCRPIAAIKVDPFAITFPEAEIENV